MKSSEIPVPRRIFHWINLVCMISLGVTGWYIHKPFYPNLMGAARLVHLVTAYIFTINLIIRIYYAFRTAEWQKYLRPRLDRETLRLTYRHYLFYDHLPAGDEYRLLQNASYLALVLFFVLQIVTGVLLFEAEGKIAGRLIAFLGGLSDVRQVHLFLLWVFITFTVIHVYMALTEEFQKFKLMMFGIAGEK